MNGLGSILCLLAEYRQVIEMVRRESQEDVKSEVMRTGLAIFPLRHDGGDNDDGCINVSHTNEESRMVPSTYPQFI